MPVKFRKILYLRCVEGKNTLKSKFTIKVIFAF